MVSDAVIMETIRRMKSSGLGESVIVETLTDIGISEDEARHYIRRESTPASPVPSAPAPKEAPAKPPSKGAKPAGEVEGISEDDEFAGAEEILQTTEEAEAIAERTAAKVRAHLDEQLEQQSSLHETNREALGRAAEAIEVQGEKLQDVTDKIEKISKSPSKPAPSPALASGKDSAAILNEVRDLKASIKATREVMDKVLDTNRKILNRLG